MKRFWLFGLAALCLALWNSPVVAEDDKGSGDEDKPRKERKHDGAGEGREDRGDGEHRKGGKHGGLDLTDKQKEPFKAIMKARHEREKAFREQLRELGKSLGELVKAEKPDESAIKSQLGKIRSLREKNQKDMEADRKKLESLLTTVQLAKLEMRELMHMGQKHGKGGKDGKGGDRRRGDEEMGDEDHPRKHKNHHDDEGEDEDRPRKHKHHDEDEEE